MNRTDQIAYWLAWTYRGQVVWWLVERVAFVIGALLMAWLFYEIETRTMPVITGWTVDKIERVDNDFVLAGTMRKERPCELLSTSVMAVPKQPLAPSVLIYQVKPDEILGGNAPVGNVTWGPWRVAIPSKLVEYKDHIAFLEIVGHHRCHALWNQETVYGRVYMNRLPI